MKRYQNTLLAGVAALALVAGTGIASAQQSNEHAGGSMGAGASQSGSAHAGQSLNAKGGAQTGAQAGAGAGASAGTHAQAQERSKGSETQAQEKGGASTNRTAQTGNENMNRSGHEAQSQMGKRGAQAEQMNRGSKNSRQNSAERQRTLKGLQGNASQDENQQGSTHNSKTNRTNQAQQQPQNNMQRGAQNNQGSARMNGGGTQGRGGNVQLSEQQRTQIRTTVINGHNAPRVGHVDFDVRVGTAIPRGRIHVVPVPETLVRIEPRWRGFLYFVYEDEIVIVNPHTYHIVAVVPA
jgi:hypothetical protein